MGLKYLNQKTKSTKYIVITKIIYSDSQKCFILCKLRIWKLGKNTPYRQIISQCQLPHS